MVVAYFGGKPVATLTADEQELFDRLVGLSGEIEFRGDDGATLARLVPQPPPAKEPLCPWDPTLTKEEIRRRIDAPGAMPLDEFWRTMGAT